MRKNSQRPVGRWLAALGVLWFLAGSYSSTSIAQPADEPTVVQPSDEKPTVEEKPTDDKVPPTDKGPTADEDPSVEDEASADEKLVKEVWQRLIAALDVKCPEGYDAWPPVLE